MLKVNLCTKKKALALPMQPSRRRSCVDPRRSILPTSQGRRDRNSTLALTSQADVIAALERRANSTNEISFVVTATLLHEDFDISRRSVRTREEALTEIVSVARSSELALTFVGLTTGDILFFQHDLAGLSQKSALLGRLCEHNGAVNCLQFVRSADEEASRNLPVAGSTGDVLAPPEPWLLSGSADRTIKIWRVCGKSVECMRTLGGHCGTVVSLSLCMPYLISSATDGALFFWMIELSRKKTPSFILIQKLQNGALAPACPSKKV